MQNQRQIAEDWLKFAVQNWQSELKRLKIKHSGDLFDSFKTTVLGSAVDRLQVEIAFKWYGSMVDAGLGRGTKKGVVDDNLLVRRLQGKQARNVRRPKKWLTQGRNSIGYQTFKLAELIGGLHADMAWNSIGAAIEQNHSINLN